MALIFVVDDDAHFRDFLQALLEDKGYEVRTLPGGEECLDRLQEQPDCILLDRMMPEMDGMQTLGRIREAGDPVPVVMLTSVNEVDSAVEAMRLGAYDYLLKPVDEPRLFTVLEKAIERRSLVDRVQYLEGEIRRYTGTNAILGASAPVRALLDRIRKVEASPATVLIQGESGTGKELVARALHANGPFARGRFVDINCGAIPESLQESELFGHVKGAFTGAVDSRRGKLEIADGGTLFLDEVGEMSPLTQTRFLRFLQEKSFERVGENRKIHVQCRVVAATNKDLRREVEGGRFREDLYYRLSVFPIHVPPLRERREDLPILCAHFLRKYGKELRKNIPSLSPEAMRALMNYSWPGNIRELENALQQALIVTDNLTLELAALPPEIAHHATPRTEFQPPAVPAGDAAPGSATFDEAVRGILQQAIDRTGGNIAEAAKSLSMSRSALYRMVKKYGLKNR
ncbi:MAG: hypothetical protein COV67_02835 [Nitrospinae bacterium CG11_big_fil_rev_8_21_14_0_20_56_8]|nr:MAG: hypothetical protein COV67_02835 [Nitrospinae bacterium CG11_big_fil_rev_8_21_14_0_20_56_8]